VKKSIGAAVILLFVLSAGVRIADFGRYVALLARQGDSSWRIDRFFGFEDSTRRLPSRP
jgi:hypothetical protein